MSKKGLKREKDEIYIYILKANIYKACPDPHERYQDNEPSFY